MISSIHVPYPLHPADICPTLLLPAAAVVNGVVGGVMGGNSPLSSSSCSGKDITDGLTLSAGAATN